MFYNLIVSCWGTKHLKRDSSLHCVSFRMTKVHLISFRMTEDLYKIKWCNEFLLYNLILSCWGTKHLKKRFFTSLRFVQNDKSSPYFIQNDKRFVQNLIKLCNKFLFYNLILSCWGTKHLSLKKEILHFTLFRSEWQKICTKLN